MTWWAEMQQNNGKLEQIHVHLAFDTLYEELSLRLKIVGNFLCLEQLEICTFSPLRHEQNITMGNLNIPAAFHLTFICTIVCFKLSASSENSVVFVSYRRCARQT